MKIYIQERRASISIDEGVFSSLIDWMPFLNDLLEPVTDKKLQLAVDATHMVETFDDFAVFQRYFMAGQMLLGAMLVTAERAYKINKKDSAFNNLPSEQLLKIPEVQDFLRDELDNVLAEKITIDHIKSVENADDDIINLANKFSKIIFNDALVNNVQSILTANSSILLRAEVALESLLQKRNEQFINLIIESTGQPVMVYFNGCEEQFRLLDKWLDSDDLQLPVSENNVLVTGSPEKLVEWFNKLRLRLENECSYQTLMYFIEKFDEKDQERYKKNINNEIKRICESIDLSDHDKRKQAVDYCNAILNKRNNVEKKGYTELTVDDLGRFYNKEKDFYLLNIYE